jgi:DNA-binding LacI/PurR family transcriptional regulator
MTDVARAAGVSHQTVSRVLNDHPHVSPRTKARVLDAIVQLGYHRNSAARALATGRSLTLGVVTIPGAAFRPGRILGGVHAAARASGYSVLVVDCLANDPSSLGSAAAQLLRQGVDGMMVIAPSAGSMQAVVQAAGAMPLVAVEAEPHAGLPVIGVDQIAVGRLATEHLLAAGHASVWHVAGGRDSVQTAGRLAGWRQSLDAAGVSAPTPLSGDWSPRSGYEAGLVLARLPDVTAVFTANDQMALGLLRAMADEGRRVPEDVSVVGADDIPEAAYLTPPLDTVRQDFREVGRQALHALLARLRGEALGIGHLPVKPALVVRRSVALRRN